jgi:amino acid adenylation domain-containing protein
VTAPYLLHQLLEAAAVSHPDGLAVVDGERTITYRDLDGRANQVAHLLIDLGVKRGDRVGLYLDKSIEAIVGLYGVLKAGAAYVPLDPKAPPARLGLIAADCGLRWLVSGRQRAEWATLRDAGATFECVVVLDAADVPDRATLGFRCETTSTVDRMPAISPQVEAIGFDLAYILYTSGSTGQPKGVMLTHLNAITFVEWAADEFAVGPDDRLSSHAPLHFDLSVFDVYAAARGAAALVLVPASTSYFPIEVARFIDRHRITVWYSVPSILSMLALRGGLEPGALPSVRTILFAGEVFPTRYLRQLMSLVPHARFVNLYGPTETNVCTWYEVDSLPAGPSADDPIPIGRAIPNVDVFAITDDGHVAGVGESGLLYVRGATVMRGYWADPERTARVLGPSPRPSDGGDPAYFTGDLVEPMADGNLRFIGRRDAQIKSRGYRIELGDIEAALYGHGEVVECAAVAVPDEVFTNRIKAFVVVKGDLDASALSKFCGERLPRYMVPELWEFRPSLPKTSTGKVDRTALA